MGSNRKQWVVMGYPIVQPLNSGGVMKTQCALFFLGFFVTSLLGILGYAECFRVFSIHTRSEENLGLAKVLKDFKARKLFPFAELNAFAQVIF